MRIPYRRCLTHPNLATHSVEDIRVDALVHVMRWLYVQQLGPLRTLSTIFRIAATRRAAEVHARLNKFVVGGACDDETLHELHTYWTNCIVWRCGTQTVTNRSKVTMLMAHPRVSFAPFSYFHKVEYGFTACMVARVSGDVTLLHIPELCELCHGYPESTRENMIHPRVCVALSDEHRLYGRTHSNTAWHAYMLHLNVNECTLFIDGNEEIHVRFQTALRPKQSMFMHIGSDQDNNFSCSNGNFEHFRLVQEKRISSVSQRVHVDNCTRLCKIVSCE